MPDLSGYRDPIILRARFEPDDRAPPPTPPAYEPESVAAPDAAESARLRRIDPPIEAVYPEAWLLGGFAAGRLGLNLLRAVARRVLSPEPGAPPAAAADAATQQRAPEASSRPVEPMPLEQFHLAPRQIQKNSNTRRRLASPATGTWKLADDLPRPFGILSGSRTLCVSKDGTTNKMSRFSSNQIHHVP